MQVYTYYNHIDCLHDPDLILLWEESWKKHGWGTVILNEADAQAANPAMYSRFCESPLLETRNPPQYALAAMLRWIPMTRVTEPALHVDWDVLCNGLKPQDLIIHDPVPTFLASSTCPCAVAASPRGWKLFAALLELAPFVPEFNREDLLNDSCDQYATSITNPRYYYIQDGKPCRCCEEEDWRNAPMIHFPNRLTKYPRSKTIRELGII